MEQENQTTPTARKIAQGPLGGKRSALYAQLQGGLKPLSILGGLKQSEEKEAEKPGIVENADDAVKPVELNLEKWRMRVEAWDPDGLISALEKVQDAIHASVSINFDIQGNDDAAKSLGMLLNLMRGRQLSIHCS